MLLHLVTHACLVPSVSLLARFVQRIYLSIVAPPSSCVGERHGADFSSDLLRLIYARTFKPRMAVKCAA